MSNRKSTWKYNKLLTARRNYFLGGGPTDIHKGIAQNFPGFAPEITGVGGVSTMPNTEPVVQPDLGETKSPSTDTSKIDTAGILSLAGASATNIGNMIGNIQANDVSSKRDNTIANANSAQMNPQTLGDNYDILQNDILSYNPLKSVTAKDMGALSGGSIFGNALSSGISGAAGGAALGPIGAGIGAGVGVLTSLVGSFSRNSKAKKAANEANIAIANTNAFNERSLNNRAANIGNTMMSDLNINYAALGGNIGRTHGANFTNGLTFINNGGSHEENPFEGVPMGVDQEGTPNLVEEGETIFNDYVFSKRLTVPNAIKNKYKLGGIKNLSFADASKKLAKESEERPTDPISKRGLQAIMSDLAIAQETLKADNQEGMFAYGGKVNKFAYAGDLNRYVATPDWEGPYPYGSKASNPDYGDWGTFKIGDTFLYNPSTKTYSDLYNNQGFKDWIKSNYDSDLIKGWWNNKANAKEYYSNEKNTLPTYEDLIKGMYDTQYSDMHKFGAYALGEYMKTKPPTIRRHLQQLDAKGNVTGTTPIEDYFDDVNDNGQTYFDVNKGRKEVSRSKLKWDDKLNSYVTDIYYRDPINTTSTNRYYIKGEDGKYTEVTGDNPSLQIKNMGNYFASSNNANNLNGTDYFYDPKEELKQGKYYDWLRYAPAVGYGVGALTSLFDKPDYSNADAVLEASRGKGVYQPIGFKPIGNYLTYNPFDRDRAINELNAQSGATRRAILQNAGLNRGMGMASLLASDNNTLNQIGSSIRQAVESDFAQKHQVEDFNRGTNTTNSQGFLSAAQSNQQALMNSREFSLKGTMAAAEMRDRARLAVEQSRSNNISGLFQTIGDIGFEERNARMRDWGITHGIFGPGTEDYGRIKKASKGGRIKRKKGLTI